MPKQDTPQRAEDYQRRLEHLRKKLEAVPRLAVEFGVDELDIAGTFLGIGVIVLQKAIGADKATDYLCDLANLQTNGELPESAKPNAH